MQRLLLLSLGCLSRDVQRSSTAVARAHKVRPWQGVSRASSHAVASIVVCSTRVYCGADATDVEDRNRLLGPSASVKPAVVPLLLSCRRRQVGCTSLLGDGICYSTRARGVTSFFVVVDRAEHVAMIFE